MLCSTHRWLAAWSSSIPRGLMKYRAGPPILYHVYGASGTFSCTASWSPANGDVVAMRIVMISIRAGDGGAAIGSGGGSGGIVRNFGAESRGRGKRQLTCLP